MPLVYRRYSTHHITAQREGLSSQLVHRSLPKLPTAGGPGLIRTDRLRGDEGPDGLYLPQSRIPPPSRPSQSARIAASTASRNHHAPHIIPAAAAQYRHSPTFIEADFFTTGVFSWNGLVSRKIALQDLVACLQELSLPEREQTAPLIVLAEADSPALGYRFLLLHSWGG